MNSIDNSFPSARVLNFPKHFTQIIFILIPLWQVPLPPCWAHLCKRFISLDFVCLTCKMGPSQL